MKKLINLTLLITLLFGTSFYSCENEIISPDKEADVSIIEKDEKKSSLARALATECDITGSSIVFPGSTASYTYTTDIVNPAITWSVVSGNILIISGQGTSTATFKFGSNFTGGSIRALGSNGDVCSETKYIGTKSDGGSIYCSCPTPVIYDNNACVSGGHPYWRFRVENIKSSDRVRWYAQHATIKGGTTSADGFVVDPFPSAVHGFTVYCEVTRTCSDGSKSVRTAYYSSYYGASCESAGGSPSKGYSDTCGSGGGYLEDNK